MFEKSMKQMSGCDRKYGRQSDVVVRSELDSLQRKCFHSIPDQTSAASINLVEGSFGSQISSLSTNEDPRFSFNKKISLMDLPHPSKLQAQAHESRKHPQKKYSVVESYLQQLKRKQSEFNWISEDEGCNKENIPQNQSGCSYIEQDPFHAVLLPFGALPAIRSSTVERSSVVLKDVKHFCRSNAQTSEVFSSIVSKAGVSTQKKRYSKSLTTDKDSVSFRERSSLTKCPIHIERSPRRERSPRMCNAITQPSNTNEECLGRLTQQKSYYSSTSLPTDLQYLGDVVSSIHARQQYLRHTEE